MKGPSSEIAQLYSKLDNYCNDPRNFTTTISLENYGKTISPALIAGIARICKDKHDTAVIDESHNKKLRFVGFKSSDARDEIRSILEKFRGVDFPSLWEDTIDLIITDNWISIKDLNPQTPEFIGIAKQFNLTSPS